jgi:membrane protease YdiL (CAAX protease family)
VINDPQQGGVTSLSQPDVPQNDPGDAASRQPDVPSVEQADTDRPASIPTASPVGHEGQLPRARKVPTVPMPMSRRRAALELIGLVPAIVAGELIGALAGLLLLPEGSRWITMISSGFMALSGVLYVMLILRLADHRPRSIGLTTANIMQESRIGALALLGTYVVLMPLMAAIVIVFFPEYMDQETPAQRAIKDVFPAMPLWQFLLINVVAVFWEELVFRGFLLTRLKVICKSWLPAVLLAAVLFGVQHYYQGVMAVVATAILAIAMGSLFAWRKSLWPGMVYHFLHNALFLTILTQYSDSS